MSDETPDMTPEREAAHRLVVEHVDRREPGPTEADEIAVLTALYGPPDAEGVFTGTGA